MLIITFYPKNESISIFSRTANPTTDLKKCYLNTFTPTITSRTSLTTWSPEVLRPALP